MKTLLAFLILLPAILFAAPAVTPINRGVLQTHLDANGKRITNAANPSAAQDLATKAYVDANIGSGGNPATNLNVYTSDNDPSPTGGGIVIIPLEKNANPGGAALLLEAQPPYNPGAWFNGKYRFVSSVATNTHGSTNMDVIFADGYNFSGNNAGVSSFGATDTNQPSYVRQRESHWQNGAGLTQLEYHETMGTPYTIWGTNFSWRWFSANLVWNDLTKEFYSSDGNLQLGTFDIRNPRGSGLYGVLWEAASPFSRSYNQTLHGKLTTTTNDVGNGGVDVQGGELSVGSSSAVNRKVNQFLDWQNAVFGLGTNYFFVYPNAGNLIYNIGSQVASSSFMQINLWTNTDVRGDITATNLIVRTSITGSGNSQFNLTNVNKVVLRNGSFIVELADGTDQINVSVSGGVTVSDLTATTIAGEGSGVTGVNAVTGDSATAFFSSGQIERARGGTAADTSAYGAGLLGSDGSNNTIDVDTEAELETALGGINVVVATEIDGQSEQDALGIVTKTAAQTISGDKAFTGNNVFTHIRRLKGDLAGGTALTVGRDYWDTFTGNRTLTFSGTPAEGSVILLHADVTTESTLTIPTSELDGGDGSTVTSVLLPVGYHNLCWIYVNAEWVLSGAPIASSGGTPDDDSVTPAKLADGDFGFFSVSANVATADNDSIALGTKTTGNYAAGDAEAGAATTVVTVDGTDTTSFVSIFDAATGNQAAKTDGALLYNAGTGKLTATSFTGDGTELTGVNSDTTSVSDTTDTTSFIALFETATGDQEAKTDAGATYNAATGTATFTGIAGADAGLTAINGENIQNDTIDDDSIDFGTSTDQVSAADVPIADTGAIFTAADVEAALLELAKVPTKVTGSSYTVGTTDPRELYGGVIYVTAASVTITAPAVAAGASFTVISHTANAVVVDVNASDLTWLDGVTTADGDSITSPGAAGDIIVFTYFGATGWSATSNGWTDTN